MLGIAKTRIVAVTALFSVVAISGIAWWQIPGEDNNTSEKSGTASQDFKPYEGTPGAKGRTPEKASASESSPEQETKSDKDDNKETEVVVLGRARQDDEKKKSKKPEDIIAERRKQREKNEDYWENSKSDYEDQDRSKEDVMESIKKKAFFPVHGITESQMRDMLPENLNEHPLGANNFDPNEVSREEARPMPKPIDVDKIAEPKSVDEVYGDSKNDPKK